MKTNLPRMLSPSTLAKLNRKALQAPKQVARKEKPPKRSASARDVVEELQRRRNVPPVVVAPRALTLLERTPVVLRDLPDWERDFMEVKAKKMNDRLAAANEVIDSKNTMVDILYGGSQQDDDGSVPNWVMDVALMKSVSPLSSSSSSSPTATSETSTHGDETTLPPPDDAQQRSLYKGKMDATTSTLRGLGLELEDSPVQLESLPSAVSFEGKSKTVATDTSPDSRVTAADLSGARNTLDRALQESVYLVVKDQQGRWRLPGGVTLNKGETMMDATRRGLYQDLKETSQVHLVSQAPVGHCANGFLYRALVLKSSTIEMAPGITDFAWLTRKELIEELGKEDDNELAFYFMLTDIGEVVDNEPPRPVLQQLFQDAIKTRKNKSDVVKASFAAKSVKQSALVT